MASTLDELQEEITGELQTLLENEPGFSESVLATKVNVALREVKQARTKNYGGSYPSDYTETRIVDDLEQFYSHIFNLALFDYNTIGIEFQTSSTENSTTRTYRDRDRLFNGITPLTRIV